MSAPKTKKVSSKKLPCSLCHKVVEELQYHYDICGPCHDSNEEELTQSQDDPFSDVENASQEPVRDHIVLDVNESEDDDVWSEEENDEEDIAKAVNLNGPLTRNC